MEQVNLRRLDLNLLVALDALLAERSVTQAANRLGISQPSMSASLRRLRRHFDDELLRREGNRYQLTPLGVRLSSLVGDVLSGAERVFGSRATFDPLTSQREFTLNITDYGLAVAVRVLCARLAERAPSMRVRLHHITPEFAAAGVEGIRGVDGVLMPHGFLPGLPHLDLYSDRWVCVVSADNPRVGEELTMADLTTLPWVDSFGGPRGSTPVARQLQLLGVEPRVQVHTESFLGVPLLIAGTERIALLQERIARRIATGPGLRILDCPFDAVPLVEALWWHPVFDDDIEHVWMRELLAGAMCEDGQ
ncbi:LysR family transcriptional regulator [Amycolatopsis thermoflava]|uniref:LysR family transcriptional regulator n=1 Tax=Amycolatopsis thermoflava TaxID=84480 RepID=UPI00380A1B28